MATIKRKINVLIVVLSLACMVVSCATFEVKEPVTTPKGRFQTIITPNQQVKTDFLSQEEVKKHFGVDLYEAGIQTLNVEIQSRENRPLNTTLDEITLKTQDGYIIRPLSIDEVTERIYNFTKYKAAFNQSLKKAGMYGLGGAALGAILGTAIGAAAGSTTAAEGAVLGAAIGAAAGTATGAAKGAMEAQRKTPEEIEKNLTGLMLTPGKLEGTSEKGLVFFEVMPEQRDISRLVVKLTDTDTRQKIDLELELQRTAFAPQEKLIIPPQAPSPVPAKEERELPPSIESIYVKGTNVNLRTDAGTEYIIVTQVKMGDQLKVIGEKGLWYHVRLPNNEEGWIAKRLTSLEKISPLAEKKAAKVSEEVKTETVPAETESKEESQVAAIKPEEKEEVSPQEWITVRIPPDPFGEKKEVDVREGPGTSYKSIAKVKNGSKLAKIGKDGGWYKVRLSDRTEGWIEAPYVRETKKPEPKAPSTEATPSPM